MSNLQEFKTVRELLSDPKRWTQNAFAKNSEGRSLGRFFAEEEACSWCLVGAVKHVYPTYEWGEIYERLAKILGKQAFTLRSYVLGVWNDDPARTHQEVLDLVTEAGI